MESLPYWLITVIVGIVLVIAGFVVTSYKSGQRPFQVLGQALYFIGIVVCVIGLLLLLAVIVA